METKKCSKCHQVKNIDQFFRISSTGKLYPHCIECNRARRQVKNMTPEQIETKRNRERVANLTLEQLENKRARQRGEKKEKYDKLTDAEKEEYNAKRRISNLTEE